ncbi:MAG: hypothetical protein ACQ5SW_09765, partial [Sphaerochaetaceae bacterium]
LPFPRWILNTALRVYSTSLNEDGEPVKLLLYDGKAFYEEKSKQVVDKERRMVHLSGRVIIEGDINPGKKIEGYIQVGEEKISIFRSQRPRNSDGSVFSTELELM